jgi:hypothetical protein
MPLRSALLTALASATLCLSAMPLRAADLPPPGPIEQLFAGPPPVLPPPVYVYEAKPGPFIPFVYAPGYYGRIGDFGQRNYYGTSLWDIWSRQPYWCFPSPTGVC